MILQQWYMCPMMLFCVSLVFKNRKEETENEIRCSTTRTASYEGTLRKVKQSKTSMFSFEKNVYFSIISLFCISVQCKTLTLTKLHFSV